MMQMPTALVVAVLIFSVGLQVHPSVASAASVEELRQAAVSALARCNFAWARQAATVGATIPIRVYDELPSSGQYWAVTKVEAGVAKEIALKSELLSYRTVAIRYPSEPWYVASQVGVLAHEMIHAAGATSEYWPEKIRMHCIDTFVLKRACAMSAPGYGTAYSSCDSDGASKLAKVYSGLTEDAKMDVSFSSNVALETDLHRFRDMVIGSATGLKVPDSDPEGVAICIELNGPIAVDACRDVRNLGEALLVRDCIEMVDHRAASVCRGVQDLGHALIVSDCLRTNGFRAAIACTGLQTTEDLLNATECVRQNGVGSRACAKQNLKAKD